MVVADAVLRSKVDACPQYPHAKADRIRDRPISREPCDIVAGHDLVVYERVFRLDHPHQTAAAQREAEIAANAQSPVVSALLLTATRLRFNRWLAGNGASSAADSANATAATLPKKTYVERYRSVTLEPRRRAKAAGSSSPSSSPEPEPTTAEEHLSAFMGQEPDALIAGILNGVASASTDQSMVKCVSPDPDTPCVSDAAILCPEYLRAMVGCMPAASFGSKPSYLMLGGGAGCLAQHVTHDNPEVAGFVSVDAEPKMITAGHLQLGVSDPKTTVICGDALKYARDHPDEQGRYDAVFVDLFVGAEVPKVFRGQPFLTGLKGLLRPDGGRVIANLPAADANYIAACEREFGSVAESRVTRGSNVIVTCTRSTTG
jgi:hypothetical protein